MTQTFTGTIYKTPPVPAAAQIFRMEDHDAALPIWRNLAGKNRILIHVDAHHDIWWVENEKNISIANFISPAVRDGIVSEIFWVVPNRSWESAENRRQIFHHLKKIQRQFPGRTDSIRMERDRMVTTLLGKPFHVCSIDELPRIAEDVLLDLDVDYMLLPRVTYGDADPHEDSPWIWPEELLSRLAAKPICSDLITIAYSVRGGFTPLRWKYLGDELEARLTGTDLRVLQGMELIRAGAEAAARGEFGVAEEKYLKATENLPDSGAALWQLANLYLDSGRIEEAQAMHRRCVQADPAYNGPFNNDGLWHFWDRRWKSAEAEFRRTLRLDPTDVFAHLGLGWIALEKSNWGEAESEILKAQQLRPDLLDAQRTMARVHEKTGRRKEAIAAYEKSMKLALAGQESLHESPSISAERPRLNDIHHFEVFVKLGELYLSLGDRDRDRALNYLRMAAAGGLDGVAIRCRLFSIEFLKKHWKAAGRELIQISKQLSVQAYWKLYRFWRNVRRPFLHAFELWRVQS